MKAKIIKAVRPADDTLPKQARAIIELLSAHKDGLDRGEFVKSLEGRLPTTQPVARVFSFYRPILLDAGYLHEENDVKTPAPDLDAPRVASSSSVQVDFPSGYLSEAKLPEGTTDRPLTLSVLRGFKVDGGAVVLVCGEDVDDHDIWLVDHGKARLVGVASRKVFPALLKAKELSLAPRDFEFCQNPKILPLAGKHANRASLRALEDTPLEFCEP